MDAQTEPTPGHARAGDEAPAATPRRTAQDGDGIARRGRTIRSRLILLVIGALFPILLFAGLLSFRYADAERRVIEAQRNDIAQNAVFILERDTRSLETALRVLAESPLLQTDNFEAFHSHAKAAQEKLASDSIVLLDRTGQQLMSTLRPYGEPLPRREEMERFNPLFQQGRSTISDVVMGTMLGQPLVVVSVPVYRNGEIAYALSAAIRTQRLNNLLVEAGLPPEWLAAVVDRQGRFIARSIDASAVGEPARPELVEAARSGAMRGSFDNVTREGVAASNIFARAPSSGWTVVIAVPRDIYDAPLKRSLWLLALSGSAVLALGIAFAFLLGTQISAPIRQLGAGAAALVRGEHVRFASHGIAEFDQIASAFDHAATERKRADEFQALLASIVENSGDPVAVFDFDLRVLAWNRAAETYFGYTAEEVVGARLTQLMPPDKPDETPEIVAHVRAGEPLQRETMRIAKDGTRRDVSITFSPVNVDNRPTAMSVIYRDMSDRNRAEAHIRFILRELSHRSKNLLAVIQAIARQLSRTCSSYDEFERGFMARIQALSHLHDLLVHQDWAGAPIKALVEVQLAPFIQTHEGFSAEGPDIMLSPNVGQTLSLALHELATNAVKYGGLSVPQGRVSLTWGFEDRPGQERDDHEREFRMDWVESNGPPVTPPTRQGFGHTVLSRMARSSLGGTVAYDFAPDGVRWSIRMPAQALAPDKLMQNAPATGV